MLAIWLMPSRRALATTIEMAVRMDTEDEEPQARTDEVRPLIAVTTSEVRTARSVTSTPEGEPPHEEMALGLRYLKAIEAAGGIPVVVPPLALEAVEPLLSRVAGVCLSGGPDLDPLAYGEQRHARIGPTWNDLDALELALARAADARRIPILAICRGLQVLNVARGGTLHQHLPDVVGDSISHRQRDAGSKPTHWVSLTGSSLLSQVVGCERVHVNSFHHQAVATLGEGLRVTGRASDGTVESIEAPDRDFVLGVQWHAEYLTTRAEQAALFRAFVDRAGGAGQATERFARVA
jgi:putative glutamine amidotransferase